MEERGIPHTYMVFPDEGHGFAKPENSMRFQAEAERFLAEHLGGRCES
jgi:dipeptidyl aminopeptidase/acylaminoacyl peptidase